MPNGYVFSAGALFEAAKRKAQEIPGPQNRVSPYPAEKLSARALPKPCLNVVSDWSVKHNLH